MAAHLIDIDPEELEKLCAMYCTQDEIAGWFRVGLNTIEKRRADTQRTYPMSNGEGKIEHLTFKEIMDRGYARGRISIRRHQLRILESNKSGAATMAVWLGKQILGQRDQVDFNVEEIMTPDESYVESVRRRVLGLASDRDSGAPPPLPN